MGWITKKCEDEYDFENDKLNLESASILYFADEENMIIEVEALNHDLETLNQIYDLLYPGFLEDVAQMMEKEIEEDPYQLKHFFPTPQIKH